MAFVRQHNALVIKETENSAEYHTACSVTKSCDEKLSKREGIEHEHLVAVTSGSTFTTDQGWL